MSVNNEQTLLKKFLLEYTRVGSRLFRNNTGRGWTGKKCIPIKNTTTLTLQKGDMVIHQYRPFNAGFPTGSSDLIGWTRVNVTSDFIGRDIAVFTAVEAKTANLKATKEQLNFIRTVNESGGIAMVAKRLEDIFDSVSNYISGGKKDEKH